jgi:hypothetical protein
MSQDRRRRRAQRLKPQTEELASLREQVSALVEERGYTTAERLEVLAEVAYRGMATLMAFIVEVSNEALQLGEVVGKAIGAEPSDPTPTDPDKAGQGFLERLVIADLRQTKAKLLAKPAPEPEEAPGV